MFESASSLTDFNMKIENYTLSMYFDILILLYRVVLTSSEGLMLKDTCFWMMDWAI